MTQQGWMVITGGSSGIGAATATLAARRGYGVCVGYGHNQERAAAVVETIRQEGGDALCHPVDVTNDESIAALFATIDDRSAPLTALVNGAAATPERTPLLDQNPAELRTTVDITLTSTLLCCRHALRRMARSRGGQGGGIVTLSSQAATFGGNRLTPYAAAKAGINTLTLGLAREAGPEGVRVNCVSPGVIDSGPNTALTEEDRKRVEQSVALGRLGRREEVAEAILWLLSAHSSYITGVVLPVAGGR
ncbi:MAG: SDR family oxidoreductase [Magnetococcales bacterium]|nr:SDR family oxidoreductase [Magnetococcales bacterium]